MLEGEQLAVAEAGSQLNQFNALALSMEDVEFPQNIPKTLKLEEIPRCLYAGTDSCEGVTEWSDSEVSEFLERPRLPELI